MSGRYTVSVKVTGLSEQDALEASQQLREWMATAQFSPDNPEGFAHNGARVVCRVVEPGEETGEDT